MYNQIDDKVSFAATRKKLAFCNLSSYSKITVYGPSAMELINSFSIRDISKITDSAFYTILLKRKTFLGEVLIVKLSPIKYLIAYDNRQKILKKLSKCKRKFPLVTVEDTSFSYSLFSFHGEKVNEFLTVNKVNSLYKIVHQKYPYYVLLTSNITKFQTIDTYKSLGFSEITLETRDIFLYNNSVILKLERIKRNYRLNTYISLYQWDNKKFHFKKYLNQKKCVLVKQFEATKNMLVNVGMTIHDNKRHKIGYVHNFYRLPNKRNPFLLGIVKKNKVERMAIVHNNREEVIVKEFVSY